VGRRWIKAGAVISTVRKRKMKKLVIIFLAASMLLIFTSCSPELPTNTVPAEFAITAGTNDCIKNSQKEQPDPGNDPYADLREEYKGDPEGLITAMYARKNGIDMDEAEYRFEIQEKASPLCADLETAGMANFAGFWIQHEPYFCLVAAFTENGEESISPYLRKYPDLANIVEVRQVKYSLDELLFIQEEISAAMEALGVFAGSATLVAENSVEVIVTNISVVNEAIDKEIMVIPDCVKIVEAISVTIK
jgi:hypothetical protein